MKNFLICTSILGAEFTGFTPGGVSLQLRPCIPAGSSCH